jgi:hypothetical protein
MSCEFGSKKKGRLFNNNIVNLTYLLEKWTRNLNPPAVRYLVIRPSTLYVVLAGNLYKSLNEARLEIIYRL